MLNIPEYKEYGGETKIALMDNSSLAFIHYDYKAQQTGFVQPYADSPFCV